MERGFCWHELTPLAIAVSATVALLAAIGGWFQNRKLAREQAAIRLIFETEEEHHDEFLAVWALLQEKPDLGALAKQLPSRIEGKSWSDHCDRNNLPIEQQQWMRVTAVLNYYDSIAVAIERKAIDEKTMKDLLGPKFVRYVEELYPFIVSVRTHPIAGHPEVWVPLERLAKKWGATFAPKETTE